MQDKIDVVAALQRSLQIALIINDESGFALATAFAAQALDELDFAILGAGDKQGIA